jgi:hypothetical protein
MTASKVVPEEISSGKPADTTKANPLIGSWYFNNSSMQAKVLITFTSDTVTIASYTGESSRKQEFVGSYQFGKSPIILKMQDDLEEITTITMTYKIKGDKLTYRFTKVVGSIDEAVYTKNVKRKSVVVDIVAVKHNNN